VICALGDLLLDVVVRVDGPIAADTDTYGRTGVAPGGQAANVAAWVAALGGEARFVGKRARDAAGRIVAAALADRGVDVVGPEVAEGTGTVVSLADADGARTMLTDRGVAPELRPEELDPGWLVCEALHVPCYSLVRSPIAEAAIEAIRIARGSGASVSLDLSGTSSIGAYGAERLTALVADLRPDVVFGNEDEFSLVGRLPAPTIVVKRGARGCTVTTRNGTVEYPARPARVVDTTGAGDALAAGFLLGGAEVGLDAAARCVETVGAFPP
jgi:ribokinase